MASINPEWIAAALEKPVNETIGQGCDRLGWYRLPTTFQ
jgi:hypothetical protein